MINKTAWLIPLLLLFLLTACSGNSAHGMSPDVSATTMPSETPSGTETKTPVTEITSTFTAQVEESVVAATPTIYNAQEVVPTKAEYEDLPDATNWEDWPELPVLSERAIEIYQTGIRNGTDPHAFSVFGDCQSLPDTFWGLYDDQDYVLPADYSNLEDARTWYQGSFDRESVTVKKGATAAAILWVGWLDGEVHSCEYGETPLQCELRIHNPSIVIISLGTHWELRNDQYLRKILDQLIEAGVLPIISTKADHREGEAWVNEEMVAIAHEYQLPVWNFWASVQSLENHGMVEGDTMYMNDAGLEMQRISGLRMLDGLQQVLQVEE